MPPQSKKSKSAREQRASCGSLFNPGHTEDLLGTSLDPDYIPSGSDSEDQDGLEDILGTDDGVNWAFSLEYENIDIQEVSDGSDSDDDVMNVMLGKRKALDEKRDYLEVCAENAAEVAQKFWEKKLNTVIQFSVFA